MQLKEKVQNSIKWTAFSTLFTAILSILQVSILARFLPPSDFGLIALVTVVMGFSGSFLDMGISAAIIHNKKISHSQLSSLYWLNVFMGFLIFSLVYGVTPLIASFYTEPELNILIPLVALGFIINSFSQQFTVLFEKKLQFKILAKITIFSKLSSLFLTTWFAYEDYGVYALVYGGLIGSFINTIQLMFFGFKSHKPSFLFRLNEIKSFLNFGLYQMAERTVNYFNYQFDTLLIGKLLGVEALGGYTIAKELIMKPAIVLNPIITKVAFPVMSKVQDDIPRLKNIYLKIINCLASLNFPIYIIIIVLAPEIILLFFGDKYLNIVPIVQILSIFGAIRSIGNPIGSLLLARGRVKLGFYWNLGMFFYTPLSIYFYSSWGIMGIAWGLIVNLLIFQLPMYYVLVKPLCNAGVKEYFCKILKPMLIALFLLIVGYELRGVFETLILKVITISFVIACLCFLLNWIFNKRLIQEFLSLIKK